jgi:hypothetical protein
MVMKKRESSGDINHGSDLKFRFARFGSAAAPAIVRSPSLGRWFVGLPSGVGIGASQLEWRQKFVVAQVDAGERFVKASCGRDCSTMS